MSEIKIKHTGGSPTYKPTSGATHKEQTPGMAAGGKKLGEMHWSGKHHSEHSHKYVK